MLVFKNIDNLNVLINKYKKITSTISLIRILMLLVLVVEFILLLSLKEYLTYGMALAITLVIFILLIIFTNKFYNIYDNLLDKDKCYKNHNLRRELKLNSFNDLGEDFKNKEDYKISDLDIFGRNSLYQYITVAKTKKGRELLARQLTKPKEMPSSFKDMVNSFANDEESINIEASLYHFKNNKKVNYDELLSVSENKIKFNPLFILPLLSFIGMIVYIVLIFTLGLNHYFLFVFAITN